MQKYAQAARGYKEVGDVRKCASDSLFVRIMPYGDWYEKKYSRKWAKQKHNARKRFVEKLKQLFYILFTLFSAGICALLIQFKDLF